MLIHILFSVNLTFKCTHLLHFYHIFGALTLVMSSWGQVRLDSLDSNKLLIIPFLIYELNFHSMEAWQIQPVQCFMWDMFCPLTPESLKTSGSEQPVSVWQHEKGWMGGKPAEEVDVVIILW